MSIRKPNPCTNTLCEADLDRWGEENEVGRILCNQCNTVQPIPSDYEEIDKAQE